MTTSETEKNLAARRRKRSAHAMDSVYVGADRQRLRQVILNLVSNAVKYNRAGGSVTISLREEAESLLRPVTYGAPSYSDRSEDTSTRCLRMEVHDTGPGFRLKTMESYFYRPSVWEQRRLPSKEPVLA